MVVESGWVERRTTQTGSPSMVLTCSSCLLAPASWPSTIGSSSPLPATDLLVAMRLGRWQYGWTQCHGQDHSVRTN